MNQSKINLCELARKVIKRNKLSVSEEFIEATYKVDSVFFTAESVYFTAGPVSWPNDLILTFPSYDPLCLEYLKKIKDGETISWVDYVKFNENDDPKEGRNGFGIGSKYLYDGPYGRLLVCIIGEFDGWPVVARESNELPFICSKSELTAVGDKDIAILGLAEEFGITEKLAGEIYHSKWVKGIKI